MPREKKTGRIRFFGRRSLTLDITVVIVLAVTLVSVVSLGANLLIVTRENEQQFSRKSGEYLSFIKESLEIPLWNFDAPAAVKLGQMILSNDIVSSMTIKDAEGNKIFEGRKKGETKDLVKSEVIKYQDVTVGHLELGLTKRLYQQEQKRIFFVGLLTLAGALFLIFILVTTLVRLFIQKPLAEFAGRIEALAKGDYPGQEPATAYAELQGIMQRFNEMAAGIKNREASLVATNQALRAEIAEREKAEHLLRESQEFRKRVFEASRIPIVVMDYETQVYIDCNPAAAAIYRLSSVAEALGKSPMDMSAPTQYDGTPSPEKARYYIEKAIDEGMAVFEWRHRRPGGEIWDAEVHLMSFQSGGRRLLQFSLIDITERKRAEKEKGRLQKQLLQMQKMEAIGTLAGGIAHDFNNLLVGIIGYTELCMLQPAAEGNKLRKYLFNVLAAAERARDLTQQILRFSRQESGEFRTISLTPMVKEVIKLIRSSLPATIDVQADLSVDDDVVLGDATQIHQVLMNFCTNGYQAMQKKGGTLSLAMENCRLENPRRFLTMECPPGDYIRLTVADTGNGIAPEVQKRMFEPYFTTKEPSEGTGLGLSVTYGIIKNHGGLIEVESAEGEGARFFIYLPLSREKAAPESKPVDSVPSGNGEKLLLVDDEPFFRDVVMRVLEGLNYQVTAFQSSLKAAETFRNDPDGFDLVITDQTMPEMTGLQLVEELRRHNAAIPVILCTGYSEVVSQETASEFGISLFMMKPVSRKDIGEAVYSLLSKPKNG